MALPLRRALVAVLLLRLALGDASASSPDPTRVAHVSWHPRAFLHEGFLSDADCDHLIALAKKGGLEKSMVVERKSGKNVESEARTSSGVFLTKKQDEVVARIEERIAAWTFLPPKTANPFKYCAMRMVRSTSHISITSVINRIKPLGDTELHCTHVSVQCRDGRRDHLPKFRGFPQDQLTQEKDDTWSECARSGYAVKPVKGDALLFFSLHPNATTDTNSLHGSCPVIEGEKWSATKWIHVRSFGYPKETTDDECRDEDDMCPKWAAAGECVKNPEYMVGTRNAPGSCRKSCNVCGE
ncbi:unnamed protein product [Urochloa decumbens]|uniref:procollagen-proline 4-dioxygenase n=1 Tax=Urochloa decumbens TaxID=240449 RepID=A0ABC9GY58_9POAL